MDAQYGGVVIVPMIIGLVEVGKRLGLGAAYAAPLAVGLGLLISVGYSVAAGLPGGSALADPTLQGLALGLSAAGLYSGVKGWQDERPSPSEQPVASRHPVGVDRAD